ncbi:MAG: DUF2934 domain-containing protein [Acidobacteriota bacterium]|nr:DUF2934 domain-containing protein [Blastocatellia bacterium]MDW8412580.1 DUF2934 domain-containing protein [Acidobacteriota bacterium]
MDSNQIRERLLRDESIREKIHRRAYEIYIQRGGTEGRAHEDWFQAENEIVAPLVEAEMQRLAETMQTALDSKSTETTTEAPKKTSRRKSAKKSEENKLAEEPTEAPRSKSKKSTTAKPARRTKKTVEETL